MNAGLKKRIMYDIVLFAGVYVVLLTYLLLNIDGVVFYPQRTKSSNATPADAKLKYEEHSIDVGGGQKLAAWYIPCPGSSEITLFYSHGNAESVSMSLGFVVDMISALKVNVIMYDYRGYGKNDGSPSVKTFYADVEAVYQFFAARPEMKDRKIVIYGRSLGGAAAIHLAEKFGAYKLITESTFASIPHQAWYSAALCVFYPFTPDFLPSQKKAAGIKCPWLIIHGTKDGVIDVRNSDELYNSAASAASKEKYVVEAGHNDVCAANPAEYYRKISEFLKK